MSSLGKCDEHIVGQFDVPCTDSDRYCLCMILKNSTNFHPFCEHTHNAAYPLRMILIQEVIICNAAIKENPRLHTNSSRCMHRMYCSKFIAWQGLYYRDSVNVGPRVKPPSFKDHPSVKDSHGLSSDYGSKKRIWS